MSDSQPPVQQDWPVKPPDRPPEPPRAPEPSKPPPWTPGETRDFINAFGAIADRLADRYIAFKKEEWQHDIAIQNAMAKADWRVLAILMLFLAVVITLIVWLVFAGRASGDALLFLVGTVSGYIFALVQRHLFPETIEVSTEE